LIRLAASSFELSNDQSMKYSLSGYVCADGNSRSLQTLKDLCSKGSVDEVIITYREYVFLLTGVTFSGADLQYQDADHTFKFHAKDVHLEGVLSL
jgi:hypothetical protein